MDLKCRSFPSTSAARSLHSTIHAAPLILPPETQEQKCGLAKLDGTRSPHSLPSLPATGILISVISLHSWIMANPRCPWAVLSTCLALEALKNLLTSPRPSQVGQPTLSEDELEPFCKNTHLTQRGRGRTGLPGSATAAVTYVQSFNRGTISAKLLSCTAIKRSDYAAVKCSNYASRSLLFSPN